MTHRWPAADVRSTSALDGGVPTSEVVPFGAARRLSLVLSALRSARVLADCNDHHLSDRGDVVVHTTLHEGEVLAVIPKWLLDDGLAK